LVTAAHRAVDAGSVALALGCALVEPDAWEDGADGEDGEESASEEGDPLQAVSDAPVASASAAAARRRGTWSL
jgi:hypothetical protein